jgi:ribosomal 50S subunit-recycling heat shock protein
VRLDKFLKLSRLIKRRTVANAFCDGGHVQINGKVVKPSVDVHVGDEVLLGFANERLMRVRILVVPTTKQVPPDLATSLYEVL